MSMPGWRDVIEMKDEEVENYQNRLISMMDLKPQELTGKTAIQLCAKQRALKKFFEDLNDEVRIHSKANDHNLQGLVNRGS